MSDTTYGSSPLARGLRHGRAGLVVEGRIIPARAGFTPPGRNRRKPAGDHPRSRGVYVGQHSLTVDRRRIIPARAGFTRPGHGRRPEQEDHPRSRGVYWPRSYPQYGQEGSSPLARGLRPPRRPRSPGGRIIPARAGFTPRHPPGGAHGPDHPRSRGVYAAAARRSSRSPGSSPLARGLRGCRRARGGILRIIPARAGFTGSGVFRPTRRGDHPRSRGVYCSVDAAAARRSGSSPLARGLRRPASHWRYSGRIIPARAGFTSRPLSSSSASADHPRSRGVYDDEEHLRERAQGSSPLARGLLGWHLERDHAPGIIPARAGFTGPVPVGGRREPDHPRSRGVYVTGVADGGRTVGSSPLARGLLPRREPADLLERIIPARAGFTPRKDHHHDRVRDHPRSRGVYEVEVVLRDVFDGIIPARAGFTGPTQGTTGRRRDHPRSRGVYCGGQRRPRRRRGIIPARAGFTTGDVLGRGFPRDHPRSRGVYEELLGDPDGAVGSSPLARGLPGGPGGVDEAGRIIPARAGFTCETRPAPASCWDHPRSRGVYVRSLV